MDSFLTLLGLALRAKKLEVGEIPVHTALAHRKAKAVYLAADTAENTADKVRRHLGETPCRVLSVEKSRLGYALGRESCALVAVTDPGFARRLEELLPQEAQHQDGGVVL